MPTKGVGIARHFTHLRGKGDSELKRNASISIRSQISGPVELIHTTNLLSYNAPDIRTRSGSAAASTRSDSDADSNAPTIASNKSSPPTSPDIANLADQKPSLEPKPLSSHSVPPKQATPPMKPSPVPLIPQRAPSHTKKNSETMIRQRSVSASTKASMSSSRSSSASTAPSHSSTTSVHSAKPSNVSLGPAPPVLAPSQGKESSRNPFGHELEKVSEIAEDFGIKDKLQVNNDEDRDLREKGLYKFRAEDYVAEIQDLITGFLEDMRPPPAQAPAWI